MRSYSPTPLRIRTLTLNPALTLTLTPTPSPTLTLNLTLTLTLARFEDLPRDVLEYAHYLGMHFPEDGRFVWLAEEGWFAPLPSGWEMRKDPEGLVYFYDDLTGLSSRHSPNDDHYRSMYYEHKYAGAEDGPYLMQLLSCVASRGLTDAIRTLSSKELLRAAKKFAEYDPTRSGVISQA